MGTKKVNGDVKVTGQLKLGEGGLRNTEFNSEDNPDVINIDVTEEEGCPISIEFPQWTDFNDGVYIFIEIYTSVNEHQISLFLKPVFDDNNNARYVFVCGNGNVIDVDARIMDDESIGNWFILNACSLGDPDGNSGLTFDYEFERPSENIESIYVKMIASIKPNGYRPLSVYFDY